MIPVERGKSWSLRDCLQGNEELERQPLGNFIKKVESIPKLVETALGIEGLICGRSIHASGTYIYNDHYIHQSSLMRAPNGVPTTCWSMEDNDTTGALKEDLLTVEGLDKIRMSLDFLLEDGKIEWKGNLRETYNAYLYPSVLDYDNPEMWNALGHNKIIDVFQFDTAVSINCLQKIKPTNLKEMAMANSLMRLSAYNGEMPMDKYARYKQTPELWEGEMNHFGLNEEEKGILRKHLGPMFGIAAEQEDIMELSMDPKISNFTVAQANILRKAVAKKKADVLAKAKGLFFEEGLKAGTRKEFLIYIWENCIMPQSGYGFSKNHTLPYSVIGLQEMNIYSRYGEVYWNAACLSVNASASDENESPGTTNYGKIAASISKMQKHGVKVSLPDINTAKFGFKPDVQNNSILFGIKGMNGVGDEVANLIIQKRPYSSFEDFLIKHEYSLPNVSVINLIKGGCFDNIEKKSREEIMRDYVKIMVLKMNPPITKLTMANFNELVEYGLYNQKTYPLVASHYSFYKYVTQKIFQRGYASQDFKVCYIDEKAEPYFKQHCMPMMTIGKEYFIKDDAILVLESRFNSWYNKAIAPFKESIKHNDALLKKFNEHRFTNAANDLWTKYCLGSIPKWEMDSLSFYYTDHELNSVYPIKAGIADFFKLSPMPVINYTKPTKRGEYTQYFIYKIIGTVLDKDKIKKTITLLTPSGVVTVNFYSDLFVEYNKQISKVNPDGKKTVVDKSWFSRGTKLQILGFRRDDQFIPRRYNDVVYKHLIAKISNVKPNGEMELITERPSGIEEDDEG
jgi:DNA polymerase-3 subunit alpha